MNRRHIALALLVLATCPACGEMQEAEPLGKTVPVAILLVVPTLAVVGFVVRSVVRWARAHAGEVGDARALAHPLLTAMLVLAPAVIAGSLAVVLLGGVVAFGYTEARVDMFSWEDVVSIAAIAAAVTVVLVALSAAIAGGILSRRRRTRTIAMIVLVAIGVLFSFPAGFGVVWLPGLLCGFWTEQPVPEARFSGDRPASEPPVGRPRAGCRAG